MPCAATPKLAANWIMGDWSAALNEHAVAPDGERNHCGATRRADQRSPHRHHHRKNRQNGIRVALARGQPNSGRRRIDREHGFEQVSDPDELAQVIGRVVDDNPEQVAQFRAGKEKVFGFFVGQIMKATQGRANPQQVNTLLRETLARD